MELVPSTGFQPADGFRVENHRKTIGWLKASRWYKKCHQ